MRGCRALADHPEVSRALVVRLARRSPRWRQAVVRSAHVEMRGCRVLAERRQLPCRRTFDIGGAVTLAAVCACSERLASASLWLPTTLSGGQSLPGHFRQSPGLGCRLDA